MVAPSRKRQCELLGLARSSTYYKKRASKDNPATERAIEQLYIIIPLIIVYLNATQNIFVDFALLTLYGDNHIPVHILMHIGQIPFLNCQKIDTYGVANYKRVPLLPQCCRRLKSNTICSLAFFFRAATQHEERNEAHERDSGGSRKIE